VLERLQQEHHAVLPIAARAEQARAECGEGHVVGVDHVDGLEVRFLDDLLGDRNDARVMVDGRDPREIPPQ
jgi:hypothetical protein